MTKHFCRAVLWAAAGLVAVTPLALGEAKTKATLSEAVPRLYEGEVEWSCWYERQRVIVALGDYEEKEEGVLRATGLQLYGIRTFFRSIPVELEIDVVGKRFVLREIYADLRNYEKPLWEGVYAGVVLHDLRVLAATTNPDEEPCVPDLVLRAVPAE